jgi:hypothetical protein
MKIKWDGFKAIDPLDGEVPVELGYDQIDRLLNEARCLLMMIIPSDDGVTKEYQESYVLNMESMNDAPSALKQQVIDICYDAIYIYNALDDHGGSYDFVDDTYVDRSDVFERGLFIDNYMHMMLFRPIIEIMHNLKIWKEGRAFFHEINLKDEDIICSALLVALSIVLLDILMQAYMNNNDIDVAPIVLDASELLRCAYIVYERSEVGHSVKKARRNLASKAGTTRHINTTHKVRDETIRIYNEGNFKTPHHASKRIVGKVLEYAKSINVYLSEDNASRTIYSWLLKYEKTKEN